MKKIGIDARFYGPTGKGLGRYAQKLVEYLEKVDGGNKKRQYVVFLRKDNFDLYEPQHKNFTKELADFRWYSFAEQIGFPIFLYLQKLDLVHFCHFNVPLLYRKQFVVTIHDLILFHYPTVKNTTLNKCFYFLKLFAYRSAIRSAAKRAKKIIAVSKFTKDDVVANLSVLAKKVEVTYEGCENQCFLNKKSDEDILKEYGIIKPYLLYVGNAYPHKNLERLVEVFDRIRKDRKELQLVLVGGRDFFYSRLEKFVQDGSFEGVIFPGYVPDAELDVLYKEAKLYVFPSLYEGFGLPPLEALAKNTAVVSSDRTSMPEILGDVVCYFDPEDLDSMKSAIINAFGKQHKKGIISKKIVNRLKKFSWRQMSKETLQVYREVLK